MYSLSHYLGTVTSSPVYRLKRFTLSVRLHPNYQQKKVIVRAKIELAIHLQLCLKQTTGLFRSMYNGSKSIVISNALRKIKYSCCGLVIRIYHVPKDHNYINYPTFRNFSAINIFVSITIFVCFLNTQ